LDSTARGVAQVEVRILDAAGNFVPTATNSVTFDVSGPAKIIGVDNGDPSSHDSYQAGTRPVFNGMAMLTLQAGKAPGHVTLTAKADGLKDAVVELDVQPGTTIPTLP
jgi:beta-galactosidase